MAVIRNKGVVYAGKVGAKMRPRFSSAPRKTVRKTAFQCVGGPMDGHTLYLTTPSTVPMNMAGQRGRYVSDVPMGITKPLLEWEPAA
ncbi:hypothetical protein [Ralstonia phage RPZH3]|nr:hypothetical protein [Ralstonia phage RPZH6]UAW00989.1 hypothetical protein [Ralstonia phage RPZH3]